jgi:hypothetical protein
MLIGTSRRLQVVLEEQELKEIRFCLRVWFCLQLGRSIVDEDGNEPPSWVDGLEDSEIDVVFEAASNLGFRPDLDPNTVREVADAIETAPRPITLEQLETKLATRFRAFGERPEWVQDAEWPVRDAPLLFLCQVEIPAKLRGPWAQQDMVVFLFLQERGEEVVSVVQWV